MPKNTSILSNSRMVVGVGAGLLLLMGLVLVAQGRVDTDHFRQELIDNVKAKTGKDIIIRGTLSVSLLPVPVVYVPGVELRDVANEDTPIPSLTVEMVQIYPALSSLFSDHPQISSIALHRPILELVRARDHVVHWDWLNPSVLRALTGHSDASLSVKVTDGKVVYHDNISDHGFTVENINTSAVTGDHARADGNFSLYGHDLRLSFNTDPGATPAGEGQMPLNLRIYANDKNQVQVLGNMDLSGETPKIKGNFSMEVEDMLTWVQAQTGAKTGGMLAQVTNTSANKEEVKTALMPLKFSSDLVQDGLNILLDNAQLQGLNSAGTGKLELAWKDQQPDTDIAMDFSALDYNQWQVILSKIFEGQQSALASASLSTDEPLSNPLPKDQRFNLDIAAKQLYVGGQTWQKAAIKATLADAAITVNQFNITLPGDSLLTLFGVISQGSTGGLRFEGSMETQGKSLRQMFTIFDESAADLPETGFGEFYARSNIFVSPAQVRLSEADVKINELHLGGGLVAYFDSNPRLEADVKLKDINFDYFRDVWRQKQKEEVKQDFFLKFDRTTNFNWLKKLTTNIDFRVTVEGFTFLDRKGDSASFRIFAKPGEFGIYNIHFQYPNETTEANFTLDVKGEQPAINVVLNTNQLNTDYFHVKPVAAEKTKEPAEKLKVTPQAEEIKVPEPAPAAEEKKAETPAPAPAPATPVAEDKPVAPEKAAEIKAAEEPATPAAEVETKVDKDKPVPVVAAAPKKYWSEDLIDMGWMEGLGGTFDISIGKLVNDNATLDNFKLQARLENNLMTFQTLTFMYWQGRCSILGSIYGGKVPGVSLSFTLYNIELGDMLRDLVNRTNITGKASVSGTVATSGVNDLSWVSQSDAKLVLAARGVNVEGLNLQGVADKVAVARTASDVFNNVNLVLTDGSTSFSVDGNINIKSGMIRTPGITLKTDTITGNLTGEVNMVPWTMELSTLFQFPTMTSETIPTMTVQLSGPVKSGEIKTDTASLEAYVAKRIVGR